MLCQLPVATLDSPIPSPTLKQPSPKPNPNPSPAVPVFIIAACIPWLACIPPSSKLHPPAGVLFVALANCCLSSRPSSASARQQVFHHTVGCSMQQQRSRMQATPGCAAVPRWKGTRDRLPLLPAPLDPPLLSPLLPVEVVFHAKRGKERAEQGGGRCVRLVERHVVESAVPAGAAATGTESGSVPRR